MLRIGKLHQDKSIACFGTQVNREPDDPGCFSLDIVLPLCSHGKLKDRFVLRMNGILADDS
jgi:hypothetical protein